MTKPLIPPVFAALPDDAQHILDCYDECIKSACPISPQKEKMLAQNILSLAHNLTDTRGGRRLGYLNDPVNITAYIRYYHWWNLVRLTRLFAALPPEAFPVPDGGICFDIGSGPLTAVSALYLARPELRAKNLTWYCVDHSRAILEKGEDLFFSLCARLSAKEPSGEWKIIRSHSQPGKSHGNNPAHGEHMRGKKAHLIIAANVYNEIFEQQKYPLDIFAALTVLQLISSAEKDSSVIVVEPGTPPSARFISFLRGSFLRTNANIISPCLHTELCPMNGKKGNKWCHFTFKTDGGLIPARLLKLSAAAKLPKEKASLSFVAARFGAQPREIISPNIDSGHIAVRIASDAIKLPESRTGFYGCSAIGLLLVDTTKCARFPVSGEVIYVRVPRKPVIDKKTGIPRVVASEQSFIMEEMV